jgi:glutathione S-transferase
MINEHHIKIYGDKKSGNCLKIKYLCDLLNISYEWIEIDILKNETKSKEFLTKNPTGQVPLIELPNLKFLAQSNAILRFLGKGSSLIPKEPFLEAKMDEWLFWEQYSHEPAIAVLRFKRLYLNLTDEQIDHTLIENSYNALRIMDNLLGQQKFFVGNEFTLADISLFAYTQFSSEAKLDLSNFSHVSRWINDCKKKLIMIDE